MVRTFLVYWESAEVIFGEEEFMNWIQIISENPEAVTMMARKNMAIVIAVA